MSNQLEILDDFEAEQRELYEMLQGLSDEEWKLPTPAEGWDVRDQVAHLADTEEVAHDTMTGGPRAFAAEVGRFSKGEDFTESGCDRGRAIAPGEVLEWWVDASARVRSALAALDTDARVPWGLGMGWRAFVTARLMEHWAHGLDIHAGAGVPAVDTDRLRHVAWIGLRALPYAFRLAGVDTEVPPDRALRLELDAPSGDRWLIGPEGATDAIRGPAGQWCRLAVQRIHAAAATELRPEGPLAELAVAHARAFL